jgi:hypothetical protein
MPVVKRAHHFIPRFHLAQFRGYYKGRELALFDKRYGNFRRRAIKQTAVFDFYYEVPGETLEERMRLEDQFARLESDIAPMLLYLAGLPIGGMVGLDESAREALAAYVALLHVRGPAWRDSSMDRLAELTTDLGALGLDDPAGFLARMRSRGVTTPDEDLERTRAAFAADILSGRRVITVTKAETLRGLAPAVNVGVPLLMNRHWELLRTDDWSGLVMGDQPVALFEGGRLSPSIGFGTPGVQVLMPLSPHMLLLIKDEPREGLLQVRGARYPNLPEPWWVTANKIAWLTSQRFVYGSSIGQLQAAEALLPADLRRRDFRILDAAEEAARKERDRARRAAWRQSGSA